MWRALEKWGGLTCSEKGNLLLKHPRIIPHGLSLGLVAGSDSAKQIRVAFLVSNLRFWDTPLRNFSMHGVLAEKTKESPLVREKDKTTNCSLDPELDFGPTGVTA